MTNISKSPERHTFLAKDYIEQLNNDPADEEAKAMVKMYGEWRQEADDRTKDPAWQLDNLEYDLRSTDWMLEKVRGDNIYAQNLYAAMCNNNFQRLDTWPILTNKTWSCSWRHAGGIVADMQETGDYINWYCSGIKGDNDVEDELELTEEQRAYHKEQTNYIAEGVVSYEIEQDLKQLGWSVLADNN